MVCEERILIVWKQWFSGYMKIVYIKCLVNKGYRLKSDILNKLPLYWGLYEKEG